VGGGNFIGRSLSSGSTAEACQQLAPLQGATNRYGLACVCVWGGGVRRLCVSGLEALSVPAMNPSVHTAYYTTVNSTRLSVVVYVSTRQLPKLTMQNVQCV
jgi:hypothetical protein